MDFEIKNVSKLLYGGDENIQLKENSSSSTDTDTATDTVEAEADKRDILKDLEEFEGAVIEVSVVVKQETGVSNEV